MANQRLGLSKSSAAITPPARSACNDSSEHLADARVHSCFKVQKPSRTATSRRPGWSFLARGLATFPDCAAKAALKADLERAPTAGWIIGSNDVATITELAMWTFGQRGYGGEM